MLKIYFCFILIITCFSCKYFKTTKTLAFYYNKELSLPERLFFLYQNKIYQKEELNLLQEKFKIVTHINGECSRCIENINLWNVLIDTLKNHKNVSILLIVSVKNFEHFRKIYYSEVDIKYLLLIDTNDYFYNTNKLYENEDIHQGSFLIDSTNRIILVGNPAISQKVRDLYIKTIKNYNLSRNK